MPRKKKETNLSLVVEAKQRETAALKLAKEAANETVHPVKNLIKLVVSTNITDKHGNKKRVLWKERGAINFLTTAQVAEVDQHTKLFKNGVLYSPEIIEPNQNTIIDYEDFIASISENKINAEIKKLTSKEVLYSLYHYLEDLRYEVIEDELVEKALPTRHMTVLFTVVERIAEVTGTRISLQDIG